MSKDKQYVEGVSSNNGGFEGASVLQVRLDTQPIIQEIEFFLRGKEINTWVDPDTGRAIEKLENSGEPKANKRGIQAVLNYCRSLINSQVVQGNFTKEQYYFDFIKEKRIELAQRLTINYYDWELPSEDVITEIVDFIMNLIEPFLTRLIGNKERDSYTHTMRTQETNTLSKGKGLFGFGGE